jgi:hypothetical protein
MVVLVREEVWKYGTSEDINLYYRATLGYYRASKSSEMAALLQQIQGQYKQDRANPRSKVGLGAISDYIYVIWMDYITKSAGSLVAEIQP